MIAQENRTPAGRKMSPAQIRAAGVRDDILRYLRTNGAATVARLAEYCCVSNGSASHCILMLGLEGKVRRAAAPSLLGAQRAVLWELGSGGDVADVETAQVCWKEAEQTGKARRDPLVAALFGPAPCAVAGVGAM